MNPCRKCGGVKRQSNGQCIACQRKNTKPCIKCGETKRAKNGQCYACQRKATIICRKNNPLAVKQASARTYKKHLVSRRENMAKYEHENKESLKIYRADYRIKNADRNKKRCRDHYYKNHSKYIACVKKRKAAQINATPAWSNDFLVKQFYSLAALMTKLTGVEHHVDHQVPLRSKLVCGFHCHTNLQVLTAKANKSKFNTVWPDMPT